MNSELRTDCTTKTICPTRRRRRANVCKKLGAVMVAATMAVSMTTTSVFAFGGSVNVDTSTNANAADMMGKIIGILLTITRFVGVALVVYGVYEVVMSFMQNQPEAKTKGIIMALAGIVMTALKSILVSLNIVGA